MLQIMQTNEDGRAKTCKMHDLPPEVALSISRKENFGAAFVGREVGMRRLSIRITEEFNSCTSMSKLRLLLADLCRKHVV